jgi:hypothetical protein
LNPKLLYNVIKVTNIRDLSTILSHYMI